MSIRNIIEQHTNEQYSPLCKSHIDHTTPHYIGKKSKQYYRKYNMTHHQSSVKRQKKFRSRHREKINTKNRIRYRHRNKSKIISDRKKWRREENKKKLAKKGIKL